MREVKYINEKVALLKYILSIDNLEIIERIREFLDELDVDFNERSFIKWNEQFESSNEVNEPLEEYGLNLGDFRKMIYEAEMSENIDVDKFHEKLKKIYNAPKENN